MRSTLLLLTICASLYGNAQQTINGTIQHGGITRSYILYIPAIYSPGNPVPLILNFHGYTSNSTQQMYYGDFRGIADTANFIVVHPMGTLDGSGQTYWNADWGGTVDDIGFTSALIDSIAMNYSINQNRIYSTGMSNGGFMSYTLACSLSNRIAAIASVTGSMNYNQNLSCSPQHPVPVMEIHGTSDATVPYNGSGTTIASIPNVLNFWATFNNCTTTPIVTAVPNTNTTDGCTAEHYRYPSGTNGVEVEHYKIINGGHTWPGAPVVIGTTNYDISASKKIWEFFSKYDINGKITTNAITEIASLEIVLFPNPISHGHKVSIKSSELIDGIEFYNMQGNIIPAQIVEHQVFDLGILNSGVYFARINTKSGVKTLRFEVL